MWNLKKKTDTNEPIYKIEIATEIEKKKKRLPRGNGEGRDNLVDWD